METILGGLANYGPIGMILLAFLLLFLKLFNRMFDNLLAQQAKSDRFMSSALEALQEIKVNCIQCRNDTVNAAHEVQRASDDRVIGYLWEAADKIIAANQRDNDLSRPHETPQPMRQPYPPATRSR